MGGKRPKPRARAQASAATTDGPPTEAGAPARVSLRKRVETGNNPGGDALFGSAILLLVIGLLVGWRVEPSLRYPQAPPFFVEAAFFAKFTGAPGHLLSYLSAALAQLNTHNWLGTAAFTAVLACILGCGRRIFSTTAGFWSTGSACVLVVVVAALPGRYEGDTEGTALGVLAALAGASVWLAVLPRSVPLRLAVCWGIGTMLFYAAGALPVALFAVLVAGSQWAARREAWPALGCLLVVFEVAFWAWLRPGFHPLEASGQWGAGLTWALHLAAYLFAPAWMMVATIMGRQRGLAGNLRWRRLGWGLGVVAGAVVIWASLDTSRQALARIEECANRREWDRVRAAARGVRTWTASARLQLIRTLFHSGQLTRELFTVYQRRGWDLLPDYEAGLGMSLAEAQTLLELGEVNLAEHMAHETLELDGARPETLRLLAKINILKDRPQAAGVFLKRLGLTPFHREEAELALGALAGDPRGTNQPALEIIRTRLPRTDEADSRLPTETVLLQLLNANPRNRMAVEYLLAHRLLNSQLEELAQDLARLDVFGDAAIPRLAEEALLVYRDRAPTNSVERRDWRISPGSSERYRRFCERSRQSQGRPATARVALAPEFGDTFWYYDLFGESAPVPEPAAHGSPP